MAVEKQKKAQLKELNKQLNNFYHQLKENYDNEAIKKIFEPALKKKLGTFNKKYLYLLLTTFFLILILKTPFDSLEWYFLAFGRILLVKILPIYDWTHLKDQQCLIPNIWNEKLPMDSNSTFNCAQCETVKNVDVYDEISEENLQERYLNLQKPIILTKNPDRWPSLDDIFNQLSESADFLDSQPCHFSSNLFAKNQPIKKLLGKIKTASNFFAHFLNCEYEAMKFFRALTPKKRLLANTCAPVQYNWLLWSNSYVFPDFKKIETVASENWKIVGQILGNFSFKLIPKSCQSICQNITINLQENEVLIFTNLWNLEYGNFEENSENVAVVMETHSLYPE